MKKNTKIAEKDFKKSKWKKNGSKLTPKIQRLLQMVRNFSKCTNSSCDNCMKQFWLKKLKNDFQKAASDQKHLFAQWMFCHNYFLRSH